jgi:hypothetical protein
LTIPRVSSVFLSPVRRLCANLLRQSEKKTGVAGKPVVVASRSHQRNTSRALLACFMLIFQRPEPPLKMKRVGRMRCEASDI